MCASNLFQKLCVGFADSPKDKKYNSFSDWKSQPTCKGAAAVNKQLELNEWVQQLGRGLEIQEQCGESSRVRRGG